MEHFTQHMLSLQAFYKLNNTSFLNNKIFLNKIVKSKKNLIGTIIFKNEKKFIFGGYGDLQAAFAGSNVKNNEILINMGTGSQIILKRLVKIIIFLKKETILIKILIAKHIYRQEDLLN